MLNELMNKARNEFWNTHWETSENGYLVKYFGDDIVRMHRWVAEKALKKPLPSESEVHHYNGNRFDNRNFNLVVCQDEEYHELLHERAKLVFGTEGSRETYAAIKKASWEHRYPEEVYKTMRERHKEANARATIEELEKREWWLKRWEA